MRKLVLLLFLVFTTEARQCWAFDVFLVGPITAKSVHIVINKLEELNGLEGVTLRIDSPGGGIAATLKLYETMKKMKPPVATQCDSECFSAAAFILAAGAKGYRTALPHSIIMIHQVRYSLPLATVEENDIVIRQVLHQISVYNELMARSMGISVKEYLALIPRDYYMPPSEARRLGIID